MAKTKAKDDYEEYIPINLRGKGYIHSPTLETVVMIEEAIKNAGYYPTKNELKKELPRKVSHQTLNIVLSYLEKSGKIMIDKRRIVWVFSPEFFEKITSNKRLFLK